MLPDLKKIVLWGTTKCESKEILTNFNYDANEKGFLLKVLVIIRILFEIKKEIWFIKLAQ